MPFPNLLQMKSISKKNGLVLGMLNLALAFACAVTFFGILEGTVVLSQWLRSYTGDPRVDVPFPVFVLLPLYAITFLAVWAVFAMRLQPRPWSDALRTGLSGAAPLFGLALLGYLGVAALIVTGDFSTDSMLEAAVWAYGLLSTLILGAGIACTAIVALFSPRPYSAPFTQAA